jgi:hypothetical protein
MTPKIRPGQKAKVYLDNRRVAFGEVLGVDIRNKVILASRPDFQTLPVCQFDLFREHREVEFISPTTNQIFIQWEASAIQTVNDNH